MPKYTQILFDADNTLFDFTASSHLAFNDLLNHFNVNSDKDYYEIYRPINASMWNKLERNELVMDEVKTQRWQLFWEALGLNHDGKTSNDFYLDRLIHHCFLLDQTLNVLNDLDRKSHISSHIITNGMKEAQRPRIKKLEIEKYFDTITVSDEIGFAKPDTQFFDHVFSLIQNKEKSQYLVVGDSLNSDIQGGINSGLTTCWYNPDKKANETEIKPDYEINDLRELTTIIT